MSSFPRTTRGVRALPGTDGAPPPPPFSPADLSLSGWWRADYGGSPWLGETSAGSSLGNDLTEGTNPPTTGTAVNGHVPSSWDGTNDSLLADGTLGSYIGGPASTGFAGWFLVKSTNSSTSGGYLASSDSDYSGVAFELYASGGEVGVYLQNSGSESAFVARAISESVWSLVTFRWTGSFLQVGVNEIPGAAGGGSSSAYSVTLNPSNIDAMHVGNFQGTLSVFLGQMLEAGFSPTSLSDADFTNIISYVNTRYGLSL